MSTSDPDAPPSDALSVRRHIRGSSLLLLGRMISLLINFVTQVLIVRYLSKNDFGAFAYAVSVVAMGSSLGLLGVHKAVIRYLPIYLERKDRAAIVGTIVLVLGSTLTLGIAFVALAFGLSGFLQESVVSNPRSVGLLLIMITLVPLQGFDSIFQGMCAVFASPRSIFIRRHILGPVLKLAAVITVLVTAGSVELLATGYLVAGIVGVAAYVLLLKRVFRSPVLPGREGALRLRIPFREIFAYSLPLVTTDVLFVLKTTVAIMVLESFRGTSEVAEFRAVLPVAALNLVILQSVKLLYTPFASRLFARQDTEAIHQLYSQTSAWIMVITFPVFAICVFLSGPITEALFGARYSDAAVLLTILAVGNYFNAALGVNLYTLNVFARVRFVAAVNGVVAAIAVALHFILIPSYGALGAAIATTTTVIVYNLLNQVGMVVGTGVGRFRGSHVRIYVAVVMVGTILLGVRMVTSSVWILLPLIVISSFGLLRWSRDLLAIADTFPELTRVPGLRLFLGGRRDGA
ncbi:MAG: flippase [Acidobacteria bacterium]|nr:flippase [Acidobacteriota bacterium]